MAKEETENRSQRVCRILDSSEDYQEIEKQYKELRLSAEELLSPANS